MQGLVGGPGDFGELQPSVVSGAWDWGSSSTRGGRGSTLGGIAGVRSVAVAEDESVFVVVVEALVEVGVRGPAFSGQLLDGLNYAASCRFRYSLWTSSGVL